MMHFRKFVAFVFICLTLTIGPLMACSMYKLSANGKTMVGSNYDAYFLSAQIWFENAKQVGEYGAVFTGGREDGRNGNRPQSGMNAVGLCFTGAAVEDQEIGGGGKQAMPNPTQYLKDVLHKCKTVAEAQRYIAQFDRSPFAGTVFLYTDTAGDYLIVEPDTMMLGHDPKLVLSNFCPSTTTMDDARKLERYRNGLDFRKGQIDPSLSFCTALSDTMHVCRARVGDGTLLTTIWDLQEGIVYLYFYHDFVHLVQFNLETELAKGDHVFAIPSLFPPNAEYAGLISYKIPQNTPAIRLFLILFAMVFFFSAFFFGWSYWRRKAMTKYAGIQLLLIPLGLALTYYMFVLATNMYIFYFPAPYQDHVFSIQNIVAYLPFVLALLIVPLAWMNVQIFRQGNWPLFAKGLFTMNNLCFWALTVMFGYWGLLGF